MSDINVVDSYESKKNLPYANQSELVTKNKNKTVTKVDEEHILEKFSKDNNAKMFVPVAMQLAKKQIPLHEAEVWGPIEQAETKKLHTKLLSFQDRCDAEIAQLLLQEKLWYMAVNYLHNNAGISLDSLQTRHNIQEALYDNITTIPAHPTVKLLWQKVRNGDDVDFDSAVQNYLHSENNDSLQDTFDLGGFNDAPNTDQGWAGFFFSMLIVLIAIVQHIMSKQQLNSARISHARAETINASMAAINTFAVQQLSLANIQYKSAMIGAGMQLTSAFGSLSSMFTPTAKRANEVEYFARKMDGFKTKSIELEKVSDDLKFDFHKLDNLGQQEGKTTLFNSKEYNEFKTRSAKDTDAYREAKLAWTGKSADRNKPYKELYQEFQSEYATTQEKVLQRGEEVHTDYNKDRIRLKKATTSLSKGVVDDGHNFAESNDIEVALLDKMFTGDEDKFSLSVSENGENAMLVVNNGEVYVVGKTANGDFAYQVQSNDNPNSDMEHRLNILNEYKNDVISIHNNRLYQLNPKQGIHDLEVFQSAGINQTGTFDPQQYFDDRYNNLLSTGVESGDIAGTLNRQDGFSETAKSANKYVEDVITVAREGIDKEYHQAAAAYNVTQAARAVTDGMAMTWNAQVSLDNIKIQFDSTVIQQIERRYSVNTGSLDETLRSTESLASESVQSLVQQIIPVFLNAYTSSQKIGS